MKTENFDDAFKQKIESLEPQYTDEDINRTSDYVSAKQASSNNRNRYSLIGFITLGGVATLGLLIWNLSQLQQQKSLLKKIDTLQNQISQTKISNKVALPSVQSKSDTVYLTKYIYVNEGNKSNMNKGETNSIIHSSSEILMANSAAVNKSINLNSASEVQKDETTSSVGKQNSSLLSTGARTTLNSNTMDQPAIDTNNTDVNIKKANQTESALNSFNETNSSKKDSVSGNITSVIDKKDSAIVINNNLSKNGSDSTEALKKQRSLFSLKKIYFQPGIALETANHQLGVGVLAEIGFNDRWSFSAGLKMLSIKDDHYRDGDDFNHRKNKKITTAYSSEILDTTGISNIGIESMVIQLPVFLQYHLQLRKNYTLLFSIGTDIDLRTNHSINYENFNVNGQIQRRHLVVQSPIVAFNNIVISVGLQKQWKNIVIQAIPFISPQLISVSYKREDFYYGVGLRALYRFGKN